MRRYDGPDVLDRLSPEAFRSPVCTVGVFDGVHRGHQQLLSELVAWADEVSGEPCVLTFERHPLTVLRGIEVPSVLGLDHRLLELERQGVQAAVVLDFAAVRNLTPAEFLQRVLIDRMGCRRFLLGFDSRVGKGGAGDAGSLPEIGRAVAVEVRVAAPVQDERGHKIGSSVLREGVLRGDLTLVAGLLGHPFALRGRVVRGEGRGAGLGAATANLQLEGEVLPPDGVYLVRVRTNGDREPGVANLGVRPTFGEAGKRTFEVHVPGWGGERYGDVLEVELVSRLRGERRFDDAAALQRQIAEDLEALRRAVAEGRL